MFGLTKKQPNIRKEIIRRKSQSQRILELLKSGRLVFNTDLQKIAFNYTMRVSELRKDGHVITAVYERPGVYRYIYGGKRDAS